MPATRDPAHRSGRRRTRVDAAPLKSINPDVTLSLQHTTTVLNLNPPLRSPPATSRFMVLRFWKFEFRILHKGFEIFHISPKVENVVLRFLLNLKIWFRDFQKISRLRRANWCIFKGNRWFAPKIPKNFRLRRENLRPDFEIFRKFQNFVTNVFEIFQKFPNLESSF